MDENEEMSGEQKYDMETVRRIHANYPHLSPIDYKCPYCGEMTTAGTFHVTCYGEN